MKEKIIQHIKALEKENEFKVLLACETGSQAWGLPSNDNDYAIQMIYIHPKDWYLSIQPKTDFLHSKLENNRVNISGWDLRKSLHLLYRSSAPLFEQIQSPTSYICNPSFKSEINEISTTFYAPISVMYHYLSIAKKMTLEMYSPCGISLKKLFIALRSALICKWVLERNERPPISISSTLKGVNLSPSLESRIHALMHSKKTIHASFDHLKEPLIVAFIESTITKANKCASQLKGATNKSYNLDPFFLRWLEA